MKIGNIFEEVADHLLDVTAEKEFPNDDIVKRDMEAFT